MKKLVITPSHQVKRALMLLLCVFLLQQFSFSQNPTVITDSLVIMNRVYAKEKLIVDQEAKFKQDVIVLGSERIKVDLRVDSVLRVDGTTRLNGNVRMENLGSVTSIDPTTELIIVLPNGQLKKTTVSAMNDIIHYPALCPSDPDADIPNPTWSNGLNKIFSICDKVKVGVGTQVPLHKLHTVGNTYSQKFLAGNVGATTDALFNGFAQNTSPSSDLIQLGVKVGGLAQTIRFRVTNNGAIECKNFGSTPSLTINNGTGHAIVVYSNSAAKILQLENNGMLRAREIKVDEMSWPDYVFDKNYNLPKLKDVAKYIDKNHHLPGVPSAAEIESDGLNLGNMQNIQMQKIEELTLYMIQMDEKMSEMEDRMKALEKENAELKKGK